MKINEVMFVDLEQMQKLAYKYLGQRKAHLTRETGFIYYHGQRVAKIAIQLRQLVLPNCTEHDQELIVAAYFHDIAKGIEPHSDYGALLVRDLLANYCQPAELEMIAELIHWHPYRDKQKNYHDYIKILQDADTLDHMGVVEIWLNFLFQAYRGGTLTDCLQFYEQEFHVLAEKMRSGLNFAVSVQIFDEKKQFVDSFIKRMHVEAAGGIWQLHQITEKGGLDD